MSNQQRCEEFSTRRRGICDRPLDEHGNCDRASEHGEHLALSGEEFDRIQTELDKPATVVPELQRLIEENR